jgi:hypothetical protein
VVNFRPRPLYPRGRALGTHWIEGLVGPDLEAMAKRKISLLLPRFEYLKRNITAPYSTKNDRFIIRS